MSHYMSITMSDFDVCKLALYLEREFNPLTGQQDPYGCGMSGFRKIDFSLDNNPGFTYLPSSFLDEFDIHLLYTGNSRKSTNILKTIDIDKVARMVSMVNDMESSIISGDKEAFCDILNEGWQKKKSSSLMIMSNNNLIEIDDSLKINPAVRAHKLCGAGGGGHFLIFAEKDSNIDVSLGHLNKWTTKITLSEDGLRSVKI